MSVNTDNADTRLWNEVKRKLFHFCSAAIPLFYYFAGYKPALVLVGALLAVAIAVEYLRMASKSFNKYFRKFFGSMLRHRETSAYTASTYLLLSSFLVILVFHKYVAILSLLYLTFGDGFAAIIGKKYGNTVLFRDKTLEGTMAFAGAAIIVSLFFPEVPFAVRIMGVLSAAVVEVIPMYTNDNIRIPILSASIMELTYLYVTHGNSIESMDKIMVWTI